MLSLIPELGIPAVVAVFLAISVLLDRYSRPAHKRQLSRALFRPGTPDYPYQHRFAVIHALVGRFFSGTIIGCLFKLTLLRISFISFIIILQYYINNDNFNESSKYFLDGMLKFNNTYIYILLSFVIIDIISFYQTVFFLRIASYSQNIVQVGFLGIADIIMSLFLVIMILPFFMSVIVIATASRDRQEALIAFSAGQLPQRLDLYGLSSFLIFEPEARSQEAREQSIANLQGAGWTYDAFSISIEANDLDADTVDRAKDFKYLFGQRLVFSKGIKSVNELPEMISDMLEFSEPYIRSYVTDSYKSPLGQYVFIIRIEGEYSPRLSPIPSIYCHVMRSVNFFDIDLPDVFTLGGKIVSDNEIHYLENIYRHSGTQLLTDWILNCDNSVYKINPEDESFVERAMQCTTGVAMPLEHIGYFSDTFAYNLSGDRISVPVLPMALSSLALTALIYYFTIGFLLLNIVSPIIERFTGKKKFVEQYTFTVTYVSVMGILTPIIVVICNI